MLEDQLLAMDRPPPISLETAKKLQKTELITLESIEDIEIKLKKAEGDYLALRIDITEFSEEN